MLGALWPLVLVAVAVFALPLGDSRMRRKSPLQEWVELIEGAVVLVLLAALFPLLGLYDQLSQGDT